MELTGPSSSKTPQMQNCEAQVNDFLYKQTNEKKQSMKHKTVGSRIHVNAPFAIPFSQFQFQ